MSYSFLIACSFTRREKGSTGGNPLGFKVVRRRFGFRFNPLPRCSNPNHGCSAVRLSATACSGFLVAARIRVVRWRTQALSPHKARQLLRTTSEIAAPQIICLDSWLDWLTEFNLEIRRDFAL